MFNVVESVGMLQNEERGKSIGERKTNKKGTKERTGNFMKSLFGIGFNLVFVPYSITRKLL